MSFDPGGEFLDSAHNFLAYFCIQQLEIAYYLSNLAGNHEKDG
jgi:hypothetical protein